MVRLDAPARSVTVSEEPKVDLPWPEGVSRPVTEPEAVVWARRLARKHPENFLVLNMFVPRGLRDDFASVYAFCRWADDLGDEQGSSEAARARAAALLGEWRRELRRCYEGEAEHPVFVALRATLRRHALPIEAFDDLISAFEQDQAVDRYKTWDDLIGYCRRSADPVGRLVLGLFGALGSAPTEALASSDAICTALQLTNFWQDVRRDLFERDRIYVPSEAWKGQAVDGVALRAWAEEPITDARRTALADALRPLAARTRALFAEGDTVIDWAPRRAARVIAMFRAGGVRVLDRVEQSGFRTLWERPRLTGVDRASLLARAAIGRIR